MACATQAAPLAGVGLGNSAERALSIAFFTKWEPSIAGKMQAAKLRAEKIGIGVSPEGQKLFDALDKTMDCRWCGKDIVCMDAVSPGTKLWLSSNQWQQFPFALSTV